MCIIGNYDLLGVTPIGVDIRRAELL